MHSESHEVLRVLAGRALAGSRPGKRDDALRVALAIEGGGMRGTVSAGMALALHELGLVTAFDAVYGSSAGAISGAWLLSSTPEGLRGWADPRYSKALIRRSRLLRRRPVVDVRALIEDVYQTVFPMDFGSVLGSPVEFHPLATDTATGQAADLRPLIRDPAGLRLALRASAAMPLLAGPPVILGGRRFYDAGLSESVPYRTALDHGATHVLVLRSQRAEVHPDGGRPARSARVIARIALRGESPALREAFLAGAARLAADDRLLAGYHAGISGQPSVASIRPATACPRVSSLATDGAVLQAALEAGRTAVRAVFGIVLQPVTGAA